MITITITSNRAEGKSTVGLLIRWLLDKFTSYDITWEETGEGYTEENRRRLETFFKGMTTAESLQYGRDRKVHICVVNTLY